MESKNRLWPQRLIWVVLIATIIFFSSRVYYRLTDDFRIANMTYEMPYKPDWEIEPLTFQERQNLHDILNQPFYYIGKGAQSYAFISENKEYVIKFFKFKHLKPNWLEKTLPNISLFDAYKINKGLKKTRQIEGTYNGYKLAYNVHRDESGLVYIHLNKSNDLDETVTLFDKIGGKHVLDLDSVVFIVQKTVTTTRQVVKNALDAGDVALAKKRMNQIIDLYLQEYSKGIFDRDHGLMHNTGFAGDRAIHLDVGKLSYEPNMKKVEYFKPDLIKVSQRFESWLKVYYPLYYAEIMEYVKERMSDAFEEKF